MMQTIVELLKDIPHPLAVFLLSMVPPGEIRVALPVGVFVWHMPWWNAFFWAVLGNVWPVLPLYFCLEWVRGLVVRIWPRLGIWLDRWIDRARSHVSGHYDRWGFWGICVFVAIPFPLTGIYSATAAAVALKIPFKNTWMSVLLGVILSGFIIYTLTLLGVKVLA